MKIMPVPKTDKNLNYEIVNFHFKNNELWASLRNKNYERLQQLVLIAPLKEIVEYLNSMNNFKDAAVGKRIRLLSPMVNEELQVGSEGTIVYVSLTGDKELDSIGVNWDCGSSLNILPYKDSYQIINGSPIAKNAG